MPVIIKSPHYFFADDDTFSTDASTIPDDVSYHATASTPIIESSDLVGISFLITRPEDNQHILLKIVKASYSHKDDLNYETELKEFVASSKDDNIEEIMSYNEILDHIQIQDDQDQIEWSLCASLIMKVLYLVNILTTTDHYTMWWENGMLLQNPYQQ